jgi:tetratricopeptide (TPR) repeat protein
MTFHLNGISREGLFIFLLLILFIAGMPAQVTDYSGLEKKAYTEFTGGSYDQALDHYGELIVLFRQKPEYHYYIGRCLLELDINTAETIDNLRFAAIKGEQHDAWFYLGKAYHLHGDYAKAVYAYNRFVRLGKRSDIKRLNVKELLVMAENKDALLPARLPVIAKTDSQVNVNEEKPEGNEINPIIPSVESIAGNEPKEETENAGMTHNDENLKQALNLQLAADSMNRIAKMKRSDLKETELYDERSRLIAEISRLENDSRKTQKQADRLFERMQKDTIPASVTDSVHSHEIIELKEEVSGIKVYQYKTDEIDDNDNLTVKTGISVNKKNSIVNEQSKGVDLFSTNKYVYNENNPIPERNRYPDKLVYHIQLGVFSKKVTYDLFGTIAPICFDEIEGKGLFKYYAGLFFSYQAAGEAHIKLKSGGYPDSFIVAFYKGEQISLDKARQIEYAQIKF